MSDTMARWPVRTGVPARRLWLVAIGVAVAVVAGQWIGLERLGVSGLPFGGLELVGIVGLTRQDEPENPIADLAAAVERLSAGADDVALPTDRADELGWLSAAVADLADTLREREGQLDRERTYTDALFDGVADVFCLVGRGGELRRWNGALSRVTGAADDDLDSSPITAFVPADERDRLGDAIDTAIETGSARVEVSIEADDDATVPYEFVVKRVGGPDETPVAAVTGRDVTDRTEREREIEDVDAARQELSRIVSDRSLSRTATIERLLELGCDHFGVDNGFTARIDEATGRYRVETAVGPGFVEEGIETELSKTFCRRTIGTDDAIGITHASEGGHADDPAHEEWGISCYLGSEIRVDGDPYGTLCFVDQEPREESFSRTEKTFADLLARWVSHLYERREHERVLRRADRALEAAPIGITMTDPTQPENPIVYANDAFERITGYSSDEYLGRNCRFLQGEGTDPEAVERLHAAVDAEEPVSVELRNYREDGTPFWNQVTLAPVENDAGAVTHFVGFQQDVTERTETERRLRERERQLERYQEYTDDVLDALDDIFFVIDAGGSLQRWNERFVEAMSYSEAELSSMHALEFFADDDRDAIVDAIAEAQETGSTRLECDAFTSNGEAIPYEFVASGLEDPEGKPVIAGIARDISDRKARERELRERERQLSTLMSNIPGMVYRCRNEPDWPFDFVSEGCAELTGCDPGTLVDGDVNWATDVVLEGQDDLWETVQEALAAREPFQVTYPIETADGERRWVSEQGRGMYAGDGSFEGLEGVIIDITEQVESERELERYETIVQALGDPVYTLDEEGYFRFVNDAIEPLTGYEPSDLVGEHVSTFMAQRDLEDAQELVRDLLRTDTPYRTFEMALPTKGGEPIEAENHVALLPSDDGSFAGTAGVVRDISDRTAREQELERTTELLEQAQQIAGIGGWELDLTTEPYELSVTAELNRLFGEAPGTEIDLREALARYHPDDRRRVVSAVDRAITEGEGYDLEVRMVRADGSERWMRTMAQPVFEDDEGRRSTGTGSAFDDGEVVALRGSIQDITDRKEREQELERATDLLERVQRLAEVGGWEMDVRDDQRPETWTEELYRLHDVPRHVTPDLELAIEGYHPEDRAFVRDRIESSIASEMGYDFEARLATDAGESRWVRAIGEPIYDDDGTLRKYRGSVQDVSDRKRRELALESLHETARGLLQAESESAVADLVVETAAEVLDVHGVGVYLLDADANAFEPAAFTDGFAAVCGGTPPVPLGDDDSALWNTFVTGTQTIFDDVSVVDRSPLFGSDVPGGLLVPIGDHGVFVFVAEPSAIDDETRRLVETLVATTEAAFDRLESEASLRDRDAELEARNRRLERQMGINEIIRSIDQSLVRATGRGEIERTVCERLVDTDDIAFAWIGGVDASETAVEPRAWDGDGEAYLDAVSLATDAERPEPAVRTALAEESTVVSNVVAELQAEPWRKTALASDFASCLCVPISFDEYSYGVLAVYGTEPDTFGDLERTVFEELGENIANSITAVQTRHALHADVLLELTLRFDDSDAFLARIARETDATVVYEGVASHSADETRLFFTTDGAESAAVESVLEDLVTVTDWRLVSGADADADTDAEADHQCLFEATVTGTELVSRLLRHGASPRSITADGSDLEVVVDVSRTTEVRTFVDMLAQAYPSVELAGRRDVERAMHTRGELVSSLFDPLTDRQLEVLRAAYFAGFFEWPRTSTGEEVAAMLDVSQPTVNRHLRIGQQRLLAELFGSEAHSIVGDRGSEAT
ncbi:PAS domain S-box protein [Halosolutus amylolyticus]|uniref:histidine kinase n=1 Tax=Halosolutus amylolyticus TaxID=2932267 RepID=A0ABD5PJP6_9EURY|nr:PAS domain S-box protein [Halosolutus amylolyticus]